MSKHLLRVGRRRVLQWIGTTACTSALPTLTFGCSTSPPTQTGYFSDSDAAVLNALADAIIPPDDAPGGSQLGVVNYIATLLTAFDSAILLFIYAGGPNSGREPFPSSTGRTVGHLPAERLRQLPPARPVADAGLEAPHLRIFGRARGRPERRHRRTGRRTARCRRDRNLRGRGAHAARRRRGRSDPGAEADDARRHRPCDARDPHRARARRGVHGPRVRRQPGDGRLADVQLRGRLPARGLQLVRPIDGDVHPKIRTTPSRRPIRTPTRCPWTRTRRSSSPW